MPQGPHRIFTIVSLVLAPLVLAGMELFHPAHFTMDPGMTAYLSNPQANDPYYNALHYFGPHWWFLLHMIQTPLVVLVSFGLLGLTDLYTPAADARYRPFAWLARVATAIFMMYYTVLDGIGGIALGRELIVVKELAASGAMTPDNAAAVRAFLDRMWVDPWVGGVGSFISLTGSWAVFTAAVSIAAYQRLNGRITALETALLLAFGWELQVAHAAYHGPIAFTLLSVTAALIVTRKRPREIKPAAA